MTEDQFATITERLDKIVALLELQTFGGPDEEPFKCPHTNAQDLSCNGMRPRERMYCPECGKTYDGSIGG